MERRRERGREERKCRGEKEDIRIFETLVCINAFLNYVKDLCIRLFVFDLATKRCFGQPKYLCLPTPVVDSRNSRHTSRQCRSATCTHVTVWQNSNKWMAVSNKIRRWKENTLHLVCLSFVLFLSVTLHFLHFT